MNSLNCYRIVILSSIPVFERNGLFSTIELWARDLEEQAKVAEVDLICPGNEPETAGTIYREIDRRIRVHAYEKLHKNTLEAIVTAADVVQIPGTSGWRGSRAARRLLKAARRAGK